MSPTDATFGRMIARLSSLRRAILGIFLGFGLLAAGTAAPAQDRAPATNPPPEAPLPAAPPPVPVPAAPATSPQVTIPNFWDPRGRPERPELPPTRTIRFLTDQEYPPLTFAGPDGNPTGFLVELSRAVCERLTLACTVQSLPYDDLLEGLAGGKGDVIASAVPIATELRRRFVLSHPVFRLPARFAARRDAAPGLDPATLSGRRVAVVGGTAHEAYLTTFFPSLAPVPQASLAEAQAALRSGEVDLVFGDGLSLALWLGGTASGECCAFTGGPYLESRFFGEGIGFVLRPEDDALRRAIDFALQALWEEGKYAELYLRFFPVGPF